MRTITKSNMKRLIAQRDEAKLLGFDKVATSLTEQIGISNTRDDDAEYHYDYSDLKQEVQASLWDAAMRAQDFYGKLADARDVQQLIEKQAEDFINSIRHNTNSFVGAYESPVPGEKDFIEVREDE